MEDIKQFELQKNVRDNCEEFRNTINDLYKWEKEIKEQEKIKKDENVEKYPEVRSHQIEQENGNVIEETGKGDGNSNIASFTTEQEEKKKTASEFKEKGNSFVKLGDYEKAVYNYTDAINHDDSDPVYFTNRALCYLKLEKYELCVNDCNKAISLSPKMVKAYYRRMQAYESLGENDKALVDCNKVLNLDPKNLEAKQSMERIKKRKNSFAYNLSKSFKSTPIVPKPKVPTWTKLDANIKSVSVDVKAAHLRSKKPLKRIQIEEIIGSYMEKDNKNAENSNRMNYSDNISDEIIDKLFNSNDCGSYRKVEKKQSTTNEVKRTDTVKENPINNKTIETIETDATTKQKIETKEKSESKPEIKFKPSEQNNEEDESMPDEKFFNLPIPKTMVQFYAIWKELSMKQKYSLLMKIERKNLNKILGACFDVETLSDILNIINNYDIKDVGDLLLEISKHESISIIALFLTDKDKEVVKKAISKIDSERVVEFISNKFNVKY